MQWFPGLVGTCNHVACMCGEATHTHTHTLFRKIGFFSKLGKSNLNTIGKVLKFD